VPKIRHPRETCACMNLCVHEFPVARCYLYNMGMSDDPVEIIAWLELGACSQPSYTRDLRMTNPTFNPWQAIDTEAIDTHWVAFPTVS
jgi:hypothetical protein